MKANIDNVKIDNGIVSFEVVIKDDNSVEKKRIPLTISVGDYSKEYVTNIAKSYLGNYEKEQGSAIKESDVKNDLSGDINLT